MSSIPDKQDIALSLLRDCPVYFLGFQASLTQLHNAGWNIRYDYNPASDSGFAVFSHSDIDMTGIVYEFSYHQRYNQPIYINHLKDTRNVRIIKSIEPVLRTMTPYFKYDPETFSSSVEMSFYGQEWRLSDLLEEENKTEQKELIVEGEEVQYHMQRIIELQRPRQKEIRENERRLKRTEAKLVSFKEVA